MFKIVATPRAWWPVAWAGVSEEGEIVENRVSMRFMLHKLDASAGIFAEAAKIQAEAQQAFAAGKEVKASELFAEAAKMFACDWRDVAVDDGTEKGKAIEWSDANLAMLMNEPGLFEVVMEAYRECLRAGRTIAAGN